MQTRRWVNPSQPQTLQIGVLLLYFNAVSLLLFGGLFSALGLLIAGASVGGAYGIANDRKWGYGLGVAMAFAPFALRILVTGSLGAALSADIISLMFEVALVCLLLHPQSRDYQRIWFK
jgi:hypothetical protein